MKYVLVFALFLFLIHVTTAQVPTSQPTLDAIGDAITDYQATLEANTDIIDIDDDSINYNGEDLNPDIANDPVLGQFFSYAKWAISSESESVFGPFAPVLMAFGRFLTVLFLGIVIRFGKAIGALLLDAIQWLIQNIVYIAIAAVVLFILYAVGQLLDYLF